MEVIVVGSGRLGAELAYRLFEQGHKVTVVDSALSAFHNLHPEFQGRTVEGEALNQDTLRRAGIETADALAAVTSSDTLNAVVAHLARQIFHTPNVIARNYDPNLRPLMEAFEIQMVGSSSWGAQRIEELLYHREMRTVFSAGNGEVEVYEFTVPLEWDGHALQDIQPPEGCTAVALTRSGRALLPDCDTLLRAGDVVLVSATLEGIQRLRHKLSLKEG